MTARPLARAAEDLHAGLTGGLWLHLAWSELRLRYRRSMIGPLWIALSTGIMVLAMGPLYGSLLGQQPATYLRHLAIGLVLWQFTAGYLADACHAFTSAEGCIRDIRLPYSVHVLRVLARHVLILAHNLLVVALVLIWLPPAQGAPLVLVLPALLLFLANLCWMGLLLALLTARFRDVPPLVASVLQLLFFVTPVIWEARWLTTQRWVVQANPLHHALDLIRAPLTGQWPATHSWIVCLLLLAGGSALTLTLFARLRTRIVYWL